MQVNTHIEEIKNRFDLTTEEDRTRCYMVAMLEALQHKDGRITEEELENLRLELQVSPQAMIDCIMNL